MIVECDLAELFKGISSEVEKERRAKERELQIKEEYSMYRCFCKLYGLSQNRASSLSLFATYCNENGIKLL